MHFRLVIATAVLSFTGGICLGVFINMGISVEAMSTTLTLVGGIAGLVFSAHSAYDLHRKREVAIGDKFSSDAYDAVRSVGSQYKSPTQEAKLHAFLTSIQLHSADFPNVCLFWLQMRNAVKLAIDEKGHAEQLAVQTLSRAYPKKNEFDIRKEVKLQAAIHKKNTPAILDGLAPFFRDIGLGSRDFAHQVLS